MTKFNGINHLAMVTGDMDKTVRYWRDLLGLRLVGGIGNTGYRHYFFEISATDLIAFFEWTGAEPVTEKDHGAPVKGPIAFDHVSLGVETDDDLWELKDRLDAAGFWVSEVVDHGFIKSVYSFDPNGIPVEFSSAVQGVDIRKNPVMGDRNPSEITNEGPNPIPSVWPSVSERTPVAERRVFPGPGSVLFAFPAQAQKAG
jgi:catechol 2,3-dioxygenase-like lactoylglutathione lyase family enzyme